jgi:hypothetical protein
VAGGHEVPSHAAGCKEGIIVEAVMTSIPYFVDKIEK